MGKYQNEILTIRGLIFSRNFPVNSYNYNSDNSNVIGNDIFKIILFWFCLKIFARSNIPN